MNKMNIEYLDELDRMNRIEEIENELEKYTNDFELDHDDIFKNEFSSDENLTNDNFFINESDSKADDSYADEQELDELAKLRERYDLNEIYSAYYLCSSENRSAQLKLNHLLLQVKALMIRETEFQSIITELQHSLAVTEQDKLLLEAKLKEVSTFQYYNGDARDIYKTKDHNNSTTESLKGQLLNVANDKILSLEHELQNAQNINATENNKKDNLIFELEASNHSLKEELEKLSCQLAQRTILYSAQERRWREGSRVQEISQSSLQKSLDASKVKLDQLETLYHLSEKEKVSTLVALKQANLEIETLKNQLKLTEENLLTAQEDFLTSQSQLQTLQSVIERLKGSDLSDIETSMARELDLQRELAREREADLKDKLYQVTKQLKDAESKHDSFYEISSSYSTTNDQARDASSLFSAKLSPSPGAAHRLHHSDYANYTETLEQTNNDETGLSEELLVPEDSSIVSKAHDENFTSSYSSLREEINTLTEQVELYHHREIILKSVINEKENSVSKLKEENGRLLSSVEEMNLVHAQEEIRMNDTLRSQKEQIEQLTYLYCEGNSTMKEAFEQFIQIFIHLVQELESKIFLNINVDELILKQLHSVKVSLNLKFSHFIDQYKNLEFSFAQVKNLSELVEKLELPHRKETKIVVPELNVINIKNSIENMIHSLDFSKLNDLNKITNCLDEKISLLFKRLDHVLIKPRNNSKNQIPPLDNAVQKVKSDLQRVRVDLNHLKIETENLNENYNSDSNILRSGLDTLFEASFTDKQNNFNTQRNLKHQIEHMYQIIKYLKTEHMVLKTDFGTLKTYVHQEIIKEFNLIIQNIMDRYQQKTKEFYDKYNDQKSDYKKKMKEKFRLKAEILIQNFAKEREEILSVVKYECNEILNDARMLFSMNRK